MSGVGARVFSEVIGPLFGLVPPCVLLLLLRFVCAPPSISNNREFFVGRLVSMFKVGVSSCVLCVVPSSCVPCSVVELCLGSCPSLLVFLDCLGLYFPTLLCVFALSGQEHVGIFVGSFIYVYSSYDLVWLYRYHLHCCMLG